MTHKLKPFLEMEKLYYVSIPKLLSMLKKGTVSKYASIRLKKAMDLLMSSDVPDMMEDTHP